MVAAVHEAVDGTLAHLARKPASDLEGEGWRGVMKAVEAAGRVLMTNRDEPEAVILSVREYRLLTELAERVQRDGANKLEQLSRDFDAELAALARPDAGDRLREAFGAPLVPDGEVVVGRSY
jgi:prevent-host-death family protein